MFKNYTRLIPFPAFYRGSGTSRATNSSGNWKQHFTKAAQWTSCCLDC